ncbi:hypothetical protein FIBSPDRAFT_889187 [Athelia psychrophila]|uniref:Uncharacterized protein n=1 Tax=Athelia psychrophila TaxID=1759441 RepID=A0A166MFP1_9AGAM|nr:hypothetical protein FIBSPDRAFT_889187 [Fibularhizoctonia sp. CBS 109695]
MPVMSAGSNEAKYSDSRTGNARRADSGLRPNRYRRIRVARIAGHRLHQTQINVPNTTVLGSLSCAACRWRKDLERPYRPIQTAIKRLANTLKIVEIVSPQSSFLNTPNHPFASPHGPGQKYHGSSQPRGREIQDDITNPVPALTYLKIALVLNTLLGDIVDFITVPGSKRGIVHPPATARCVRPTRP